MRFPGGDPISSIGWILERLKQLIQNEATFFANGAVRQTILEDGMILTALGSDPTTPASGKIVLYSKVSGGLAKLFAKYSDGTVVGPIT